VDVTRGSSRLADSRLGGRDLSSFRTSPCALGSISPVRATTRGSSGTGAARFTLERPYATDRGHTMVCSSPTGQGIVTYPSPRAITPQSPVPVPFPQLETSVSKFRDRGVICKVDAERRTPSSRSRASRGNELRRGYPHAALGPPFARDSHLSSSSLHLDPFPSQTLAHL